MAPTTIPQAIDRYERQLRDIERLAYKTWSAVSRTLTALSEALPPEVHYTTDLRGHHVVEYFAKVGPQWADGTYNLYCGQVRRWLQYLAAEGLLGEDQAPWRNLKPRKRPKRARPIQFLRRDDAIEIAAAATEWHVRDKYLILLSYAFRRRVSEIVDMTVGDIDLTPRPDMPHGLFAFRNMKGRRDHSGLPIVAEDRPWVDEWLTEYENLLGRKPHAHEPLFPALKPGPGLVRRGIRRPLVVNVGKPLPAPSATEIYQRAQKLAGNYVKYRSTHAARRGGLDDLLALVDNDIRFVKTYADHANEATTEIYLERSRDVADLARKLNGRHESDPAPAQTVETSEPDSVVVNFAERRARRKTAG